MMTYEEFEWNVLRMAYEEGVDRLKPTYLAYAMGLPAEQVKSYLDEGVQAGVFELDLEDDGALEYTVPGIDPERPLPVPLWRSTSNATVDAEHEPSAPSEERVADGTDGQLITSGTRSPVAERMATVGPVVSMDARSDGKASYDMVPWQGEELPMRVESNSEAFCDPSRTIFMRQIRVYGEHSREMVREQVMRLFNSFGYRMVDSTEERMRLQRGSIMFILALVPLFVLVIPLFVYLFLYCAGRSTIEQEPVELDVRMRNYDGPDPFWEIDLTFVGLHGVVLGAADQKILNREIDTLRDELSWALS